MGLDMYLYKRTYVGNQWKKAKLVKVSNLPHVKTKRLTEVIEEVAYWRKANHIHKWFMDRISPDNSNNGSDLTVSTETLKELLETCDTVIKASKLIKGKIQNGTQWTKDGGKQPIMEDGKYIENPEVAIKLLPTEAGFFFGSTDYNQYYLEEVKDTHKMLTELLAEPDSDLGNYYYSANW